MTASVPFTHRRRARAPAGSPRGDLDAPAMSPCGMGPGAVLRRADERPAEYLGACVCSGRLKTAQAR